MKQKITAQLVNIVSSLGIVSPQIKLEYPESFEHGDLTTNIALVCAKQSNISPKTLADKIVGEMKKNLPDIVADVSVAGPGFINFKLKDELIAKKMVEISISDFNKLKKKDEKIMIEYTDPNLFKAFHVGHIMSNAIGESISRLVEFSGMKVVRICYSSDIGLHIAKSIWAMQRHLAEVPLQTAPIEERTAFLGKMYVEGTKVYEENASAKNEIDMLNQTIYDKSDKAANELYKKGKQWSLDHFNRLYELLGSRFDDQIFESEVAPVGLKIVEANKGSIFEESDGAVVFKGENYGLHTRVFINSHGLPTYEAKDVGLNVIKFKKHPDSRQSVVVTANEQNDYFKVLTKVFSLLDPENGPKTKHIGHGILRFASGKMSSRKGNVVTAEQLLEDIKNLVRRKIADRKFSTEEAEEISNIIAVGAIKYTILRQAIGGDVIFDSAASISFEGDSGPYLQYSAVRAALIINKEKEKEIKIFPSFLHFFISSKLVLPEKVGHLEKLLVRFEDIAERARGEYAPQLITNYLTTLAGAFNSFYASQTIIDEKDPLSVYRVTLTKAFLKTMTKGLWLLGIKIPERM